LQNRRSAIIEPTTDVLNALRAATAERHAVLDAGLPIARAEATLDDYRSHLLMLRAWLAPLEAWLSRFDDGPQALPAKPRLSMIEADLGECAPVAGAAWPAEASAAYRWGVCYVIEGSQLGGAVLYQRLRDRLAPHPLDYLRGEAEGPGPRWRMFMQALKAEVTTAEGIEEACRGACDAFDRILALR
jgi:heme oxygenase (biliverdin-IX-beta and delta-forming)